MRDFTLLRGFAGNTRGSFGKKLDRRREPHAVHCGKRLLGHLRAVEVGHFARASDVELENLEIGLDVALDVGPCEIDQMRLAAIGAAAQLPHDRETLPEIGCALQVVGKLEILSVR